MTAAELPPEAETFLQRRLRLKAAREASTSPLGSPSAVVTLEVGNKRAQRWAERALDETCLSLAQEAEGGRNHALNAAAYKLGRLAPKWLEEEQVHDRLFMAAINSGLAHVEARQTIRSGLNAGMLDPRDPPVDDREGLAALVDGPVATRPAQRIDVALPTPRDPEEPEPVSSWAPLDLSGYLDGSYTPPQPNMLARQDGQGLIYPQRVHWLSGEPEALKSWLALLAVAQVLRDGGRAAYIDLEDGPAGVTGRLLGMGLAADVIDTRFAYIAPQEPLTATGRVALKPHLVDCALVVIDACTESLAQQQLSPKDDVDIASWLALLPRWLARQGCAVLVLDHVVKDTETRGRWATGSQHKLAGLDGVAFTLEAVEPGGRGMRGRSRLYVSKDRHGEVRPHTIRVGGNKDWVGDLIVDSTSGLFSDVTLEAPRTELPEFRPTVLMTRVSEALTKLGRPLTGNELCDRVKGKRAEIHRALACLVDDGFVTVETGPNRARMHTLARPYPPVEEGS